MFQKITAIIIFFVLIFGTCGYYCLLKYEQFSIKEAVALRLKKSVPKEQLSKVVITKSNESQIDWERAGKEFSYIGKMYDVVYTEHQNGTTIYYCLSDKEETTVLSKLDDLVKKQIADNGKSDKTDKTVFKIFFSLNYYPTASEIKYSIERNSSKKETVYLMYYSSGFFTQLSPPPKYNS